MVMRTLSLSAVVALAAVFVAATSSHADKGAGGDAGVYLELGGGGAWTSDPEARFEFNAPDVEWNLKNPWGGAKLQVGYDFGEWRTDLKLTAFESEVDDVNGADIVSSGSDDNNAFFGTATLNLYYDLVKLELDNGGSVTPFIGIGAGVMGAYMEAVRTGDRVEKVRAGYGPAGHANVGVLARQ